MKQTPTPSTTAVAVAQPQGGTALANIIPINSMEDVSRLGIAVAKSGWFGSITQSTGEMIAMTMLQERISPVTFKKKYHVMGDGSLSVASRAIVSAFKRIGGKMKLHEVSKDKCDITFIYDGNELRHAVTLQEFIDNGVAVSSKTGALKDNWAKFSGDMLYARCCSFAIRKVCPEADDGLYTTEEVADFDAAPAAPREPVKIDKAEVVSRLAREAQATQSAPSVPSAPAQPAEAVKIDKAEVVSRLAKSAAPAPSAPVAAPAQPAEAEVVEPVAIEMPKPTPKANVAATPMDEAKANLAAARAAKDVPPAPDNPFVSAPPITPDATTCPIEGKFYNVPFADMEPDILMYVLMPDTSQRHPELTPAHIEAAKAAARAKGLEV